MAHHKQESSLKAITLRNIPEPLARRIEERASRSGASLNRTLLDMLDEKAPESDRTPHHDFDHLKGTWSAEEAEAFDAELAALRTIDSEPEP